ncbi:MAG TPA: carboxymuconolactone decarboxylase family protein [Pseudogracilibacillus sp.]|nr:carboxymuconolactone decarboxylase family protein [Pseudogracilibacillus sp.]
MTKRVDYATVAPEATNLLVEMEKYIAKTDIEVELRELIKIRVSQINGCAFCLKMHTKEAREIGMTNERIDCVAAYDDGEMYTEREKVALEFTEYVTQVAEFGIPDDLYNRVREHFSEKDFIDLVFTINQIKNWNRVCIACGCIAKKEE